MNQTQPIQATQPVVVGGETRVTLKLVISVAIILGGMFAAFSKAESDAKDRDTNMEMRLSAKLDENYAQMDERMDVMERKLSDLAKDTTHALENVVADQERIKESLAFKAADRYTRTMATHMWQLLAAWNESLKVPEVPQVGD